MSAELPLEYAGATDITLPQKGEVLKRVLRPGAGDADEVPKVHDTVELHIEGYQLDGTLFESTRNAGGTRKVVLGLGEVCPGLELAVASMRKGERSRFLVQPGMLSHGEHAVEYELEVFGWEGHRDLEADGGIAKLILRRGEGPRPLSRALVAARLCGRANGQVVDARDGALMQFSVDVFDDKSTVLDETVSTMLQAMRKGELAHFRVQPANWGAEDPAVFPTLARDAMLEYTIDLITIQQPGEAPDQPLENLTPLEKLERAHVLKERGNASFRVNHFEDAALLYSEVFDVLTKDYLYPPDLKAQSRALKVTVSLNTAACQLHLGQFADVVGICTEVLTQDKKSLKAFFRRGQAHQQLGNFDDAIADFETVLTLEPGNSAAAQALAETKESQSSQYKKDSTVFKGMFNK